MYSLPITTYSDYWRATKVWTSYLGGLAVFAAGTRYSALGAPDITQTLLLPFKLTTQSLNTKNLSSQVVFLDSLKSGSSQGIVSQGETNQGTNIQDAIIQNAAARGVFSHGEISYGGVSRGLTSQEVTSPGVQSQEVKSKQVPSEGVPSQVAKDRRTSRSQVVDKEIPFETQFVESDKLPPGTNQKQVEGENGILRQFVKTFEVEGQPIDQQVQASYEFKSPKNEVIIQNSKPVPKKKVVIPNTQPAVEESPVLDQGNISKTLIVVSTAYTFTGNNTATGVEPREGIIAVDPNVIAMGSKVYVEGYGYAIAADTGGDIRGNRIDVFFSTLRQCINWGRKPVHIYVLDPK